MVESTIHPAARGPGERNVYRGTIRACPPEATLARLQPRLAGFGITRIANVTGLDRLGIPVINVVRPNSRSVSVSTGKGVSVAAAKVSGIMESIEAHCAENIDAPLIKLGLDEMARRHHLVDVARLPRVSGARLGSGTPTLWIEGFDLMGQRHLWLPYELVHNDYSLPGPAGAGYFPKSSNGLASGNNLLEAITHAIFEVVERDAVTLFHYLFGVARTYDRVRLDHVPFAEVRQLHEGIIGHGLELHLWDITTDVGVPCYYCMLWEPLAASDSVTRATVGSGCHTETAIAMSRAITEAAQDRLTLISGARDDLLADHYMIDPAMAGRIRASLRIDTAEPALRDWSVAPAADVPHSSDEEVRGMCRRLTGLGIDEVVVVDLSPPGDPDLAVVKVVIPGLEAPHDDPGYEPGPRLRAMLGVA